MNDFSREIEIAKKAALKAGSKIMEIYSYDDYEVRNKEDNSPVTVADLNANTIIMESLRDNFPDDGYLTEEEKDLKERLDKERVWIIDPLDGTKDFIAKNDEFTVNIALVIGNRPVLGVIYWPVKNKLYHAIRDQGSFEGNEKIAVSENYGNHAFKIVRSRNHPDLRLIKMIKNEGFESNEVGSSLKGCLIAEGQADAYFRFGSQSEWDICAMSIIIEEAGGKITSPEGKPLKFNQENTRIHGFLASNNKIHDELLKLHNLYKPLE